MRMGLRNRKKGMGIEIGLGKGKMGMEIGLEMGKMRKKGMGMEMGLGKGKWEWKWVQEWENGKEGLGMGLGMGREQRGEPRAGGTQGDSDTHDDAAFYPHVHLLIEPHLDPGSLQITEKERKTAMGTARAARGGL